MKIPEKTKEKKGKIKKNEKIKPKKEHVLIVAQEIKFARLLSGNEKKTRDKVLKTLKKWLLNCFEKGYEFKEDDFIRVWKGLFYAVWMSDKPLIQEELCENISAILDVFPEEQLRYALLMYKAGLRVLASEWYGLDQHRIDKFLMLVRRYLRASLRCLLRSNWSLESCQMYADTLAEKDGILALKTPHYARNSMSMLLHILDCYLEEIAKVSGGDISDGAVAALLRPVCAQVCAGAAPPLCAAARRLLTALLRQSEPGLHYQQATEAWQKMGCPEGGPEALELVSDDEEDDDDEQQNGDDASDEDDDESRQVALDPRAGRVDVELPLLPVPSSLLAQTLRQLLAGAAAASHKRGRICLQRFEQLSMGEYPLRVESMPAAVAAPLKPRQAAQSLHQLEKKLLATSDELALRGLSRKHRKRLLAKSRSGASIVEEVDAATLKLTTKPTNDGWQVETAEPEAKKPKQNTNKQNKRKNDTKHTADRKKRKIETAGDVAATTERPTDDKHIDNKIDNVLTSTVVNGNVKRKDSKKNNEKKDTQNGVQKNNVNKKQLKNDKTLVNGKNNTKQENVITMKNVKNAKNPSLVVNKVKQFQKQTKKFDKNTENNHFDTPKKVKFALKNNCMQQPVDYYKSVRQSPNIPFDGSKKPSKTNLKPSTPSPINPFFKKKLRLAK